MRPMCALERKCELRCACGCAQNAPQMAKEPKPKVPNARPPRAPPLVPARMSGGSAAIASRVACARENGPRSAPSVHDLTFHCQPHARRRPAHSPDGCETIYEHCI